VVHLMNHWQHFLLGAKFKVPSDHQPLLWMFGQLEPPKGKVGSQDTAVSTFSLDRMGEQQQ